MKQTSNRVFFPSAAALASVCKASARTQEVAGKAGPVNFKTRALCQATSLTVAQGMTYRITLKLTDPWEDGHKFEEPQAKGIATGPNGFGWDRMTWKMVGGIALRRFLSGNWFQTIVRIGATGVDERPLTFKPVEEACACPKPEPTTFASTFWVVRPGSRTAHRPR